MQLIEKVLVVGILAIIATILAIAIAGVGSIDEDPNGDEPGGILKIAAQAGGEGLQSVNGASPEIGEGHGSGSSGLPIPTGRKPAGQPTNLDSKDGTEEGAGIVLEKPVLTVPYRKYVVQSKDTFESIAEKLLGDKDLWEEIAKLNEEIDPKRLAPNTEIYIPTSDQPRTASGSGLWKAPPAAKTYIVKSGDNLSSIARAQMNTSNWQSLWNANRDVIGDPNSLKPGMTLKIPTDT